MDGALLAPLLVGGVGALLGTVFLSFGWLRGRMVRDWARTTGIVVNRDGSTTGLPAIYPTFRWRDQHGQVHQRTSAVRASLGPSPGNEVAVLFDPDKPSRAVIDSPAQSGQIFTVLGAVILLVGLVVSIALVFALGSIN